MICRPKPGQEFNGDSFSIKKDAKATLVSMIDGLGHGEMAYKAANAAKFYVENNSEQPLLNIFQGVNQACHGTNGVVMALVQFDWQSGTLSFASVGNIEAKIFGSPIPIHLTVTRGIVGRNAPKPKVCSVPWVAGLGMILHTDGLSSRWRWQDYDYLHGKPAQIIAENILRKHESILDDACLMIIKQT